MFEIDGRFRSDVKSFNMTPIVDIVFLLIIFFLVVCQFIDAENFPVVVPDGCEFAQTALNPQSQLITVTIMKTAEGSFFAVGSEKISVSDNSEIAEKIAELIDARLKNLPGESRIITLRIDEDICFGEAQYALAGVAASSAKNVQLAAIKNERIDLE